MNFIFTLVLFGTFAQRFLRHSINADALIDGKDSDNLLSSDGTNVEQVDGYVKFTGYVEEIELELSQLKFEYCSKRIRQNEQRCMGQRVFACYDAVNPTDTSLQEFLQDGCGPNQCRFEAGISTLGGRNLLWFMKPEFSFDIPKEEDICESAKMKSPRAEASRPFASCKPSIINGKIKLYGIKATPECFLTVKNAKIWTPTTTPPPAIPSPATQASPADKCTKEETSDATILWAIVGVILFYLFIIIIAFA
uniref:Uncharacterized protein n=1 Tax=Panagrolaimus davidi TaxID=227884 RepID=A0A914P910_9BILA